MLLQERSARWAEISLMSQGLHAWVVEPGTEIEMPPHNDPNVRELQQDARAWADFTGTNYTAALRQMRSPLAQGLLGARVSARQLIGTLTNHPQIGVQHVGTILGENGFNSEVPWSFDGKTDFIELALIVDLLKMFTPISNGATPEVSSYALKHTAERFFGPHCSYVSNGRLIWGAAALGLPIAEPETGGPNLYIGVSEREHDYVSRSVSSAQAQPKASHYRPARYEHLQDSLALAAVGELPIAGRAQPTRADDAAPFHEWLMLQIGRGDGIGDLAGDYSAGVRSSDHRIARTPDELLAILHEVPRSRETYDAAVSAIAEWVKTAPESSPIRTQRIRGREHDHDGWGAGAGTTERYEFRCPCGDGAVIEEHENVPGFREHDVRIDCGKCRTEWRFVDGRSIRDWRLEPAAAV